MFSFLLFIAFSPVCPVFGSAEYGYGVAGGGGPIEAAIKSDRSVNTIPVESTSRSRSGPTPVVDINTRPASVTLRFNSYSSNINAIQKHIPRPGIVKKSEHNDEADIFIMKITKPIVQKVREVIVPIRQQTTEIQPVREKVQTIIASNEKGMQEKRGAEQYQGKGGETYGENEGAGEPYGDRRNSEGSYAGSSDNSYGKEASNRKETREKAGPVANGNAQETV